MTPPDPRPATVHGGDALDWHDAYKRLRASWAVLKGVTPEMADVYWPAGRLPITRPHTTPSMEAPR